ncbi:DNA/RNA non-specific endonuclease [Sphingomonas guangdongensis]|uniref:DNA/RNA non-specific endonuclease n=1 Tax=Sphingomonas guangdongensis TaxID=1141890 RepID=A0A285QB90_9SPHN|nr:DNA/RNA non-specific endonuclease [Sphingomonas guangdongensis]SOB78744.1 DNA/RNA non-specific endonuclease [Sphingomonas guangdongensis]
MSGATAILSSIQPSFQRRNDPDPAVVAGRAIADADGDMGKLRAAIEAVKADDPALGTAVEAATLARLTPVQRGDYASARYSITAPDAQPVTFQATAPTVRQDFDRPADASRAALYARFDRIWGDGNAVTDDVARIEAGLRTMQSSGLTLAQVEAAPRSAAANGPDLGTLALDLTQIGLDVVGIFEPTPFADGSNAVISLGRGVYDGITQRSWGAFGSRALDAGISGLGVFSYVGDTAKLARLPKLAGTVADAVRLAASNPAAREALEPGLRAIKDAVDKIPTGAIEQLPTAARESIQTMKTQLDELFGAGARGADEVADAGVLSARIGRNSVEWTVDAQGRPTKVSATLSELQPSGAARGSDELAAQDRVRERGLADDDAGHVIGHRFLGDQGTRNMFPQNFNFNRSAYKTMENEWAAWIENGGTVKVNVELLGGTGDRPDQVRVAYEVLNEAGERVFRNGARFANQADQVFARVPTADIRRTLGQ